MRLIALFVYCAVFAVLLFRKARSFHVRLDDILDLDLAPLQPSGWPSFTSARA